MRNWKVFALVILTIAAGAFFVGRSSNTEKEKKAGANTAVVNAAAVVKRGTEVGNLAPEFQLAKLDGATLSLDDLRGQPSVLVFWASWCQFCREEAPHVNKLADEYSTRGVRVFGVNIRESQARTEAGIKNFGISYTVVRDADGVTERNYNVDGIPTVVILDSEGTIQYVGNGVPSNYSERLDTLLAQKEAAEAQ
jgi:peroxiredoxin